MSPPGWVASMGSCCREHPCKLSSRTANAQRIRGAHFSLIPFMGNFWCFPPLGSSELLFVSEKWEQKVQPLPKSCPPLWLLPGFPFALETPQPQVGQDPSLWVW